VTVNLGVLAAGIAATVLALLVTAAITAGRQHRKEGK
jgi:hypothetical protein